MSMSLELENTELDSFLDYKVKLFKIFAVQDKFANQKIEKIFEIFVFRILYRFTSKHIFPSFWHRLRFQFQIILYQVTKNHKIQDKNEDIAKIEAQIVNEVDDDSLA
jgi:hypothetical protein